MAHVVKHTNHLKHELRKVWAYWVATAIAYPILTLAFLWLTHFFFGLVVLIPLYILVLRVLYKRAAIYRAGYQGESRSLDMFSGLPDAYTVLSDLDIEYDGKTSQVDTIVVGPTGVFVIETKNVIGKIEGHASDREWTQHKKSANGNAYTHTFYNPTKQVGTHVYRVANYLKSHGIRPWVQGMVFFSHPDAEVHSKSYQVPVFSQAKEGPQGILGFIQARRDQLLSEEEQTSIVDCLSRVSPSRGSGARAASRAPSPGRPGSARR